MPLIQKYHNLSEKTPKPGQKVILYQRTTSRHYTKVIDSGYFTYHRSESSGAVYFLDPLGRFYIISSREKHMYQYLKHHELNKLQHWFGEYYLGILLLAILIYWIIDLILIYL